ncbi:MAG: glycosyltransferase family 4 protein [Capsulimonadaceae bacterium]
MRTERDPFDATRAVRLLFVGNLVAQKNPLVFCRIMARLRTLGVSADAIILGDGPDRLQIEEFCRAEALTQQIRIIGKVPNADVFRYMRQSDILVSTSNGEPYGRNIVEAMVMGTIPICHRSGGPAEIVRDGVNGLLIDELDPDAYATGISTLARDAARMRALSTAASEKVKEWSSRLIIDRLESVLIETAKRV